MSERFEDETPTSAAFPPRELWLYNPMTEGRREVIYDPYGYNLVDVNATLADLLTTIETRESGYQFTSDYADIHHAEHDEAFYPYLPKEPINPREFRTLASNQLKLPRVVHAWWHRVYETPKMASPEGMRLRLDAQLPVTRLAHSMNYANELSHDREGRFSYKEFHHQVSERLWFYANLLDSLREVPKEFQIVSADNLYVENVDDAVRIARMFKRYARPKIPLPIVLNSTEALESEENNLSIAA